VTVLEREGRSRLGCRRESTERLGQPRSRQRGRRAGGYGHLGIERNFVVASDKVYGAHDDPPGRETAMFEPRHPYDVSIAATGPAGISYWHTFG